jgi:hyaluronan synthase
VDSLFVVDDGSGTEEAYLLARGLLEGQNGAIVHRLPENQGKRHAQGWAMHHIDADVILTVDSDTVLDRFAVAEGLRAFDDPEVQGVTGNVQAINGDDNLITRISAVRYANAFLWDRAAYSAMGTVLCACGSLSFWRREVIADNLDDYLNQSFLGIPVMYGDDRRLTNYALERGQVLFQDTSIAYTAVPERLPHLVRQQLRWNKSFFRETLWVLRHFSPKSRVWGLSFSELALWVCFSVTLVAALLVVPVLTGELVVAHYLIFPTLMAYARNVRFLGSQPLPLRRQLVLYGMSPVYAILHLVLLTPLRLWALCTLRQRGWGTRAAVELRFDSDHHRASDEIPAAPPRCPAAAPWADAPFDCQPDTAPLERVRLVSALPVGARHPRLRVPVPAAGALGHTGASDHLRALMRAMPGVVPVPITGTCERFPLLPAENRRPSCSWSWPPS